MNFHQDLHAKLSQCTTKKEWLAVLRNAIVRKPRFGFNTHGNVIPVPNPGGKNVTLIAAMDSCNGIGKNNQIPWAISPDMQQFKRLTTGHPVIMGRKTFDSFGGKSLPNRTNVVISRDRATMDRLEQQYNNVLVFASLEDALTAFSSDDQIFIIGGAEIYRQALELDLVHDMILTRISHDAQCDTFFPDIKAGPKWQRPVYSTHELSGGVTTRYEYWQSRRYEDILKE
jgi:dihydrofolate reductase